VVKRLRHSRKRRGLCVDPDSNAEAHLSGPGCISSEA
jgi:hypothetical protein